MAEMIFGIHAVTIKLSQAEPEVSKLLVADRQDAKIQKLLQLAKSAGVSVERASREQLTDMVGEVNHQGVVAVLAAYAKTYSENDLFAIIESANNGLILALDGVQDPHNLGACLRSADAAGVIAVIAPKDRSSPLTAVAKKVACGAAEIVPFIQVTNLVRTLENLKEAGYWSVGLTEEAEQSLYEMDLTGPSILVLGAEGDGLRRLTKEKCDFLAKIPMAGAVSSLNVSVATGVSLFEAVRQRL
jgi:23S rRNA (guanosine2251-2'-O)-methyltransferase